jgi:hypothetical protein
MGVRCEWADERQIIMNVYLVHPWTWAEYHVMMEGMLQTLRDVQHPCATVVDCSHMRTLPSDGNVLNILLNVEKQMPNNVFASVIVAAPQLVSVFMNILTRLRPRAEVLALFTSTTEEAYEKIYARHQELYPELQKTR